MKAHEFATRNPLLFSLLLISICACNRDNDDREFGHNDYRDIIFEEPAVTGKTFYIDPVNGRDDGDGSLTSPWKTLQAVVEGGKIECYEYSENYNTNSPLRLVNEGAPVKGGDRLVLLSGYHGYLHADRMIFEDWLTIEAGEGQTPVLSQIKLIGAFRNIYLKNLTVIKSSYEGDENYWEAEAMTRNSDACVYMASNDFRGDARNIKVNGLTLKTTTDVSSWSAADWTVRHAGGISLRSVTGAEIVNCHIENVRHGIVIEYFSDHTICMNNRVKNFSGDGARIISNDVFFGYNTITDCYKVDDNHDDGIQSYTRGDDNSAGTGILTGVTIRGNLIIGTTDFDNPLAGSPQGIGCFDGMFDHWVVENNVVITDHYHGISFYGITNSRILHNTVIDQFTGNDTSPWILIHAHKNGTSSRNCIVANNIVASSVSTEGEGMEELSNYVIGRENYDQVYSLFSDPDNFDLHLPDNDFTSGHIVDQGEVIDGAVSVTMDKDNRLRSIPPDLGAYELNE